LLHVRFGRRQAGWHLDCLHAMSPGELASDEQRIAAAAASAHIERLRKKACRLSSLKPKLAILRSPDCPFTPSNPAAIQKFQEAAELLGMRPELITRSDTQRLTRFDGLFIRDTTSINHYTYQLARQTSAAGMVVMDDPDSILKCSNKIYMAELLGKHHLPMPRTLMVNRGSLDQVIPVLGLPCILKQPDGCFSMGVEKAESREDLAIKAEALFGASEVILAQEYLPTRFDWRVGVLDRQPLFVCRYFMAPGHWQIIKHDADGSHEGYTEAVPVSKTPQEVLDIALRAANLIGDGFYGVDVKQCGRQCFVIEINDNPNVDAGNEDGILRDDLYRGVMGVFKQRIEARKRNVA
jgi:glutathione synthase/RimK-type ligase-like ATP-grasp enzyme